MLATSSFASVVMIAAVKVFPPAKNVHIQLTQPAEKAEQPAGVGQQLVNTFTVSDFPALLSKKNMLALIVFAILFGLAVAAR